MSSSLTKGPSILIITVLVILIIVLGLQAYLFLLFNDIKRGQEELASRIESLNNAVATLGGSVRDVSTSLTGLATAIQQLGVSPEVLEELRRSLLNLTSRVAAIESGLRPTVVAEFKVAGWWPWPYTGNPYGPGGVGILYWFSFEPFAYPVPANRSYIPRLAESWSLDGSKLTVRLKTAYWNDGRPVRADDIITSIYMAQALWSWPYDITDVSKVDDKTVVITFRTPPGPPLLNDILTSPFVSFAPHHIYGKWFDRAKEVAELGKEIYYLQVEGKAVPEDLRAKYDNLSTTLRNEVQAFNPWEQLGYIPSNGLFMLTDVSYDRMVLTLNKNHWQAKTATADKVIVYRWSSNEAVWALLMAGELDASHPATPKDLTDQILKINPQVKLNPVTDLSEPASILFNFRNKLFQDVNLRKALILSLNRTIVRDVSYWIAWPEDRYATGILHTFRDQWLTPDFLAKISDWSYNTKKAEEILTSAGYYKGSDGIWRTPQGEPVKFTISAYAPHSDQVLAAKEIARQWKEFGFDVEVTLVPEGMWGQIVGAGEFDTCVWFGSAWWGYTHPYTGYNRIFRGEVASLSGLNATQEFDTPWGKLRPIDLLNALAEEKDPAKQKEIVEKLAWITNEYVLYIPTFEKALMIFYSEVRFTGWPPKDSSLWSIAPGGIERLYVELIGSGVLKPRA